MESYTQVQDKTTRKALRRLGNWLGPLGDWLGPDVGRGPDDVS